MIVVPLFFIAYATTTTTHTHTLHHFPRRGWQQGGHPPPAALGPCGRGRGGESCEGGLEGPKGQASCRSISALEGRTVKYLNWFHRVGDGCRPKYIAQAGGKRRGGEVGGQRRVGCRPPRGEKIGGKRWLHNPRASPARRSERSGRRKVGRLVEGREERDECLPMGWWVFFFFAGCVCFSASPEPPGLPNPGTRPRTPRLANNHAARRKRKRALSILRSCMLASLPPLPSPTHAQTETGKAYTSTSSSSSPP